MTRRPDRPAAEQLRRLRAARGWTVYHLADRLGTTPATVDRLERGAAMPAALRARAEVLLRDAAGRAQGDRLAEADWLQLLRARLEQLLADVPPAAVRRLARQVFAERPAGPGEPEGGSPQRAGELSDPGDFELLQGRWRRKRLGQYYTPDGIVERALDAVWPRRGQPRILDPACGGGAFLLAAGRRIISGLGDVTAAEVLAVAARTLTGLDLDPVAAITTRLVLIELLAPQLCEVLRRPGEALPALPAVQVGDFLADPPVAGRFDLVVGNPPYLEAKRMPRELKARLRRDHPESTGGAFDLYQPFLARALDRVSAKGALAFVLPNKFCVARAARPLRQRILERFPDVRLLDLSVDGEFRRAAVYPVVLAVGDRRPVRPGAVRHLRAAPDQVFFPLPAGAEARDLFLRLARTETRLAEYLTPRWTVSFHRSGLRDRYFSRHPCGRRPRRILGGPRYAGNGEVQRYRLRWDGWWIDYDPERARTDRNPLPDPALFAGPKLVVCQNSRRLRAAVDESDHVLKDTFLALVPTARCRQERVSLHALAAVLNSGVLHFFYATHYRMTHVAGGYLHFLGQYLRHLPLVVPRGPDAGRLTRWARAAARADDPERFAVLDRRLERAVGNLYGLSDAERGIVRDALPGRERR